jgi:mxaK protein
VLYAGRVAFIWLLLAGDIGIAIASAWNWYAASRDNRIVAALAAGQNVEIDPNTASSNLLFARAHYLLKRDRIDEAQVLLDQVNFRGDPATRVKMLYNAANTRLRAAFGAIEQGQFDKATAFVNLAKEDYNAALRLDPRAWDVKYNLDLAARLVRDLPEGPDSEDPLGNEPPQQIWTELPGIPKGQP